MMFRKNKKTKHSISSVDNSKLISANSSFAVKEAYNSIRTKAYR